jgi:lambda family phage portal protein
VNTKTALRIRNRWSKAAGTAFDIANYQQSANYNVGLNWNAPWGNTSSDGAMRYVLFEMRAKCKSLESNPYGSAFYGQVEANVLGSEGMPLQMQIVQEAPITLQDGKTIPAGGPDKGANSAIEDMWYAFWYSTGQCEVTGELSGPDFDKMWVRSTARDGSMPVRIIRGFDNDWKFALQAFEADQFDLNFNKVLSNGNEIRMSVEKNIWGRPVAYYLTPYQPGDWMTTYGANYFSNTAGPAPWSPGPQIYRDRIRIPAEEIINVFPRLRVGQTWGWPWLRSVIDSIHGLGKYSEAELIASRAAAEKMGFFVKTQEADQYTGEQDSKGNFSLESIPGMIQGLDPGWTFQGWDPKHPNGNFAEYRKTALREIASGVMMSYGNLANDRSDSSFSAERTALKNEQECYKMIQRWFIDNAKMRVFPAWLEMALMAGKIKLNNGAALPSAKFDKFNKPAFSGRRWGYVLNPLQEIEADILAVDNGFAARRDIISENGGYVEDTFDAIEQDNELAKDRGEGKPPLVFGGQVITKIPKPIGSQNVPTSDVTTGNPGIPVGSAGTDPAPGR